MKLRGRQAAHEQFGLILQLVGGVIGIAFCIHLRSCNFIGTTTHGCGCYKMASCWNV